MAPPLVLLTRPEREARELALRLMAVGIATASEPMLEIRPVEPPPAIPLEGVQALLFTSGNGARAFAALSPRRDLPALAVGPATAAELRQAGFTDIRVAEGDARALAALAGRSLRREGGRLLHLAGEQVAGDLKGELESQGFACDRLALYRAVPRAAFSGECRSLLREGRLAGVLLFSPRTADAFARLARAEELGAAMTGLTAWCLSEAVADAARSLPWRHVRVAGRPDQEALLALLREDLPLSDRETREPEETGPEGVKEAPASPPAEPEAESVAATEAQAKPERRSGGGTWLVLLLLLLVISGALALWLSPAARSWLAGLTGGTVSVTPSPPPGPAPVAAGPDPRIAELATRLAALENRPPPAPAPPPAASSPSVAPERLAALESRIEELAAARAPSSSLEERLARLESRPEPAPAVASEPVDLAPLGQRIDALAARLDGLEQRLERLSALEGRFGSLEQRLSALDSTLASLRQSARDADAEARSFGLVVALTRLGAALRQGLPYEKELASARELGADALDAGAFAALAARAAQGVPADGELARRFARLAPAILTAERAAEETAWWQRTLGRIVSLVSIRRTGEIEGDAAEAVVARVELRLAAGELVRARDELARLAAPAAATAAEFRAQLEARLAAEAALADLDRRALAALAGGARSR